VRSNGWCQLSTRCGTLSPSADRSAVTFAKQQQLGRKRG
jgi:hypothetical protein